MRQFIILIVIFTLGAFLYYCQPKNIHIFPGLKGPLQETVLPTSFTPTSYKKYSEGTESRLAILLTDTNSSWLGLVHGLKSIGLPFLITTDYKQAINHKVVMVYPIISGKVLSAEALKYLAAFPKTGGTLIGTNILGGGLNEIFGFKDVIETKKHTHLTFNKKHAVTSDSPELFQTIKIGSVKSSKNNVGTNNYTNPKNTPLAVYEDGTAAITYKSYGEGEAYAVGLDYGHLLLNGYNNREDDIAKNYVNNYEPTLDTLLNLILKIYKKSQKNAVTLATVPNGKSLAVMITHDVDYIHSLKNSINYAKYELSENIKTTYFIQVKYLKDYNDNIFFNDEGIKYIKQLEDMGMEVASHSVAHSRQFNKAPLGSGKETYPEYRPFVHTKNKTTDATIMGELRVSKFLLDNVLKKDKVISFRPGVLRNPYALPQALKSTGYLYSSSVTANNSLTHLPFQLNYNREYKIELEVFEFPITIEDEELPEMYERLPQAIKIAEKLKNYGGTFVVLIHPNILGSKLKFEKGFVNHVKDYSWFGTISEFGQWWTARNKVQIDVKTIANDNIININAVEAIKDLTINIPNNYRIKASFEKNPNFLQIENKIIIKRIKGNLQLKLEKI